MEKKAFVAAVAVVSAIVLYKTLRSSSGNKEVAPMNGSVSPVQPTVNQSEPEAQPAEIAEHDGPTAWILDHSLVEQRLPHQTPHKTDQAVGAEQLAAVGVQYCIMDPTGYEEDPTKQPYLMKTRNEHNYKNFDIVTVSKDMLPNFEDKIQGFWQEHLHEDEEIRYILDGSGFFDVRDKDEQWIRIAVRKGSMIVLPEGIFHRFTLGGSTSMKVMRLFKDEPKWASRNRSDPGTAVVPARLRYIESLKHPALEVCEAWIMDDSEEDQRTLHKQTPNVAASFEELEKLGVLYWKLAADHFENDNTLEIIREERGYKNHDLINVSKDSLPDYENKIKMFFQEHLHEDEEIRYILDGSGFFDVRGLPGKGGEEAWVRVAVRKGDMIVLPEGVYHRFTLDENNYIKAMRLFKEEPKWACFNRSDVATDALPSRKKYETEFGIEGKSKQLHIVLNEDLEMRGGAQIWLAETARRLTGAGHRVTVIAPATAYVATQAKEDGIPLVTYEFDKVNDKEHIAKNKAAFTDVLKTADVAVCLVRIARGDFQNVRFIGDCIHDADLRIHLIAKTGTVNPKYERSYYVHPSRDNPALSSIVTISKNTGDQIIDLYQIPREVVTNIYNGTQVDRFDADPARREAALKEYVVPEGSTPVIGCIGSFVARKGQTVLFDAVKLLKQKWPKVHVVLIGEGPDEELLKKKIVDDDLADHITMFPFTATPERLYEVVDITAVPSFIEGLPNVNLESMAMGIPTVSSDIFGIPEVCVNGVTGYLVEAGDVQALADGIDKLWSDQALYATMKVNCASMIRDEHSKVKQFQKFLDYVIAKGELAQQS